MQILVQGIISLQAQRHTKFGTAASQDRILDEDTPGIANHNNQVPSQFGDNGQIVDNVQTLTHQPMDAPQGASMANQPMMDTVQSVLNNPIHQGVPGGNPAANPFTMDHAAQMNPTGYNNMLPSNKLNPLPAPILKSPSLNNSEIVRRKRSLGQRVRRMVDEVEDSEEHLSREITKLEKSTFSHACYRENGRCLGHPAGNNTHIF